MTVQEMKTAVCAAIDNNREKILALGDAMYHDAETGYREYRTAAKIQAALDEAGLEHQDGVAMTGILTPFNGRDHKVHISLMGELDGLIVPSHPCAVPETGMAHACGHSIQAAALVGVAYALKESGVMNYLDGDIISGMVATGIYKKEKINAFFDIGTNGELVLGIRDFL